MTDINHKLRKLPAVDKLINSELCVPLIKQYGREATLDALRAVINAARESIIGGEDTTVDSETLLAQAVIHLESVFRPTLLPVINATGVIIHTNLGRTLLSETARQAMFDVAGQYNTIEFDLESGGRGSRYVHAEALLCELTGAEAALVVNNTAAALVLVLSALGQGREVIISRGQLVEIGGGFRVPDIMQQSGATLVEVGTTNRTRATDYECAITEDTAMLMAVHTSNFKQIGFTESTALSDLAQIAHARGLYLLDDIGSGTLIDTAPFGLEHEPMVQESIAAGSDLVTFSGDKLLGGPQAGIIAGAGELIAGLKRHPLVRSLRVDKLCYAALNATLDHYRKGEALTHIPVWRMVARQLDDIRETAGRWAEQTGGTVIAGESTVGGGSLPGATLPTALLALDVESADSFAAGLREIEIPIIARITEGRVLFDPRTVLPEQEMALMDGIHRLKD